MPKRAGFTLIELVAVLGIMTLVATMISATLGRHQRLYRAASETLDVRRSVRDGVAVLAEELRGASAGDTIRLMSDSAIELFTSLGSSVVCGPQSGGGVPLAPITVTGVSLTDWLAVPDTGDLALIYRTASGTPPTWERHRIAAVSSRSSSSVCPTASGFGSGGSSSYVLTLSPAAADVPAGEPLRFIRRGRYSLYKSSDGRWYLGYRRCNAIGVSGCGAIQPISGYYQAYSADGARTGLRLTYFDRSGQPVTASSVLDVARIDITARSSSATPVVIDADPKTARDSASISVALRNSP